MASLLDKISDEVSSDLGGIDWAALETKFGKPREELVYDVSGGSTSPDANGYFAYVEVIRNTYDRFDGILKQCVLSFQVEDNPNTAQNEVVLASRAWDSVQKQVLEVGDTVLTALKANVPTLSKDKAVTLEQEKFRAIVSSTQLVCMYGCLLHFKASMQLSRVAPEDIVDSADRLVKTMNGIIQLWDMGALDTLKRSGGAPVVVQTSGLGAIPAGVIIAIFATLAVGILAWCIVSITKQLEVNRQMRAICEDAIRRQDQHAMENCMELLKINSVATDGGPGGMFTEWGKAVLFVGIGFVLIKLAGPVAKMLDRKTATA